jgi:hypothetical protein
MLVEWLSEPEVPVTVTLTVPVVAVAEAVNVSVEVALLFAGGVIGFGTNAAVTPLGSPEEFSVVAELNPFWLVMVIVLVAFEPCTTVTDDGAAPIVKFALAFTVKLIVVVCVREPEIPVTVTVAVPVAAVALAVKVSTLVVVVVVGLKAAVTPLGRPEADRVTLPVNPFSGLTVIVLVPLEPCVIVRLLGEAESVKSGCDEVGQLFTRFVALTVPMPVAKSHPVAVPYAGK